VPLRPSVEEIRREGVRRGGARREREKGGRGMKGRVDVSRGIVKFAEALAIIKPTEPSRLAK
jgi:hypothetical protein